MIGQVTIAGSPVLGGRVVVDGLTVIHGRGTVADAPTAASATVTLLQAATEGWPGWAVADQITVTDTAGQPLFTGSVADRRLTEHVDTVELGRCARIEVECVGPLAALGTRIIGDEPWPVETGSARAERILQLAGVPYLIEPHPTEPQVLARDVDAQPALGLLTDLAASTGAAVVDLPDGRVVYQALEARTRPVFVTRWTDLDPDGTWAALDPGLAWADLTDVSPAAAAPVTLPPDAVGWEPVWVSTAASILNTVRVGYGPTPEGSEQPYTSVVDPASVTRYGRRDVYLGTELADLTAAQHRASHLVTTRAWERWALAAVDVYPAALTPEQADGMARLACGAWVQVLDLPQPAPATGWAGIVEGWTYREWQAGQHTRANVWTLALSDPVASLAVYTWADYLPPFEWDDHNPIHTWSDLVTLEAS